MGVVFNTGAAIAVAVAASASNAFAALIPPSKVVVTAASVNGDNGMASARVALTATYRVPQMPEDADYGGHVEIAMNGFAFAAAGTPSGGVHLRTALTGHYGDDRDTDQYAHTAYVRGPTATLDTDYRGQSFRLPTRLLRPDSCEAGPYLEVTVDLDAEARAEAVHAVAMVLLGDLSLDVFWAAAATSPVPPSLPATAVAGIDVVPSALGDLLLVKSFDGPLATLPPDLYARLPAVLNVPEPATAVVGVFATAATRRRRSSLASPDRRGKNPPCR